MSHFRTVQKMSRYKTNFAPSLQKKIDAHQGDLICAPRNLNPEFDKVAKDERRLKIEETQRVVQKNLEYLKQIVVNIDIQKTHRLNNAFYLTSMEAVSFREMIQQCKKEEYIF